MIIGFVIGVVIDAGIIGVIVAAMEGEFPGWGAMIGTVLLIGIAGSLVASLFPGWLTLLGLVAGAAVGALVLTWLCGMTFRRGFKAAGIYLGVRLVLGILWMLIASA